MRGSQRQPPVCSPPAIFLHHNSLAFIQWHQRCWKLPQDTSVTRYFSGDVTTALPFTARLAGSTLFGVHTIKSCVLLFLTAHMSGQLPWFLVFFFFSRIPIQDRNCINILEGITEEKIQTVSRGGLLFSCKYCKLFKLKSLWCLWLICSPVPFSHYLFLSGTVFAIILEIATFNLKNMQTIYSTRHHNFFFLEKNTDKD